MNRQLTWITSAFGLVLALTVFSASSGGVANVQKLDRTGSPLGQATCQSCHNQNVFSPTLDLKVLSGNTPVTAYVPGQTYTLQVVVKGSSNAPVYGFQAVAMSGMGHVQAGSFQNAPVGVAVRTVNNRSYAEQSFPSTKDTFRLEWVAPLANTGDVRLYASGVAGNGNGSSSGDGSASGFLVLPEDQASSLAETPAGVPSLTAVQRGGMLEITTPDLPGRLTLLDLSGRPLQTDWSQGGRVAWQSNLGGLHLLVWEDARGEQRLVTKVFLH